MLSPDQTKWLLAIVVATVIAVALSVPPATEPNASSQKAFDEVGDWVRQHFGDSWWLLLGVCLLLSAVALSATDRGCQWTILGVASLSGMIFSLMGSVELSANEFRLWCLANAGIVGAVVYSGVGKG